MIAARTDDNSASEAVPSPTSDLSVGLLSIGDGAVGLPFTRFLRGGLVILVAVVVFVTNLASRIRLPVEP